MGNGGFSLIDLRSDWRQLLDNENNFPSGPLAPAVHMQGVWKDFQVLLQRINYEEQLWNITL